jgi:predicted outer membrane repeat protein
MTDGLIRNSDTDDLEYIHLQKNGGAVYLEDGKFTMSGGEIRQCRAEKGGAIYVKGTASTTFNMTGGTITQCAAETDGGAVYLQGGTVNMSGGIVSHNLANNGNGGGFCIVGGDFTMNDTEAAYDNKAKIYENAAFSQNKTGGMGGGIYVTSAGSVDVSILSGSITENSSDRVGGGIAVDMTDNDTATASVTVGKSKGGKENPLISNNHTIIMGGGLYAKGTNANITINSGKIKNNTISGYVSNPDVANEEGSVTLNGGDVTHVTVTYNNNAKFLGLQESYVEEVTQDIVTATKSRMVVSKQFSMPQHTFNGWNTRPDGNGTAYTHGQIMNLSSDLTLFAQWKRN